MAVSQVLRGDEPFRTCLKEYYVTHEVRDRRRNFSGKRVWLLSEVEFVSCDFGEVERSCFKFASDNGRTF
jgi:hypothetical protein